MKNGDRGAISEMVVCVDLMEKGFDVYRATSPHAPWDLVVWKNGEIQRIEVRSALKRKDGTLSPCLRETDLCDMYAFVHGTEVVYMTPEDARADFIKTHASVAWRRNGV